MRVAPVLLLAAAVAAGPACAHGTPESFAGLADRALPAVVNISTAQTVGGPGVGPSLPPLPPNSPFRRFFEEFFERRGDLPPRRVTSLGSGFVVDPSGIIVTNDHVIEGAEEILVRFQDDTELEAEVVGRDPKTDLAVLRVEPEGPLPFLEFGDSSAARVGDWVIAIGNPFDLGGTVTAGIVSARKRDINAGPYDEFLQTDAAINRGNSGGPMLNLKGEVIGVNTVIFSPSGGSIGIGFAVPSSLARPVIRQLREHGETRRGWLGVGIQEVTREMAESGPFAGFGEARGALVSSVVPGSPAAEAGVRAGDVIVSFDGDPVATMRRLPRMVSETEIGSTVALGVWRRGGEVELRVVIGRLEEGETMMAAAEGGRREVEGIGITVASVTDELRREHDLDPDAVPDGGVVVVAVDPASDAARKGLAEGDVVVEVDWERIDRPGAVAERVEAARAAGRKSVLMLVDRKGVPRYVAVAVE